MTRVILSSLYKPRCINSVSTVVPSIETLLARLPAHRHEEEITAPQRMTQEEAASLARERRAYTLLIEGGAP